MQSCSSSIKFINKVLQLQPSLSKSIVGRSNLQNYGELSTRRMFSRNADQTNVRVIFSQVPAGLPNPKQDFSIATVPINLNDVTLQDSEILVRLLYASVDPYMRGRLRDPKIQYYFPAAVTGEPMSGGTISQVIRSTDPKYSEGDVLLGFGNWESYSVASTKSSLFGGFTKIPDAKTSKLPLSYYLGVLGMPGITAYIGLHKICEPLTPGQTIYISAAAGAVGQVVGQYAKSLGLRVVGSAGDDAKVDYLLKELKFDDAFNYKKVDKLSRALRKTCPNGIDIYFENVGGKMLDAVLVNANQGARFAMCGMISQYNRAEDPEPIFNLINLVALRIKMEGFIVTDDVPKYGSEAIKTLSGLLAQGKLIYKEDVTKGIENLPKAFVNMLEGKNFGKAVVHVADVEV